MRRLIIRPGAIGDCILAIPAMQFLRTGYTEIWVPAPVVPLIQFADRVCSISSTGLDLAGLGDLPMDGALASRLRQFDEVVSWYGTNRQEFCDALYSLGIPVRFLRALPPPDSLLHASSYFCNQVGAPDGQPRIDLADESSPRGSVVLHPFSGSRQKNWPLSSFRALASMMPSPVEWLAGPEEELEEAHRFDDLAALAVWLKGAALYIGNDSGITHLAAALGVQTIALFGPTDPAIWGPRGEHVQVLRYSPISELPPAAVYAIARAARRA